MKVLAAAFLLSLAATSAVVAQDRDPARRQVIVELSRVIGEAHALRQICKGPDDQFWRSRMMSMLEAEDADFAFSERLRNAFNTGFVSRKTEHLSCTPGTREAEAAVSARGQDLARRLAAEP